VIKIFAHGLDAWDYKSKHDYRWMLRWAEKIDKVKWHPKRNPHAKVVNSIFDSKDYKLKSD